MGRGDVRPVMSRQGMLRGTSYDAVRGQYWASIQYAGAGSGQVLAEFLGFHETEPQAGRAYDAALRNREGLDVCAVLCNTPNAKETERRKVLLVDIDTTATYNRVASSNERLQQARAEKEMMSRVARKTALERRARLEHLQASLKHQSEQAVAVLRQTADEDGESVRAFTSVLATRAAHKLEHGARLSAAILSSFEAGDEQEQKRLMALP